MVAASLLRQKRRSPFVWVSESNQHAHRGRLLQTACVCGDSMVNESPPKERENGVRVCVGRGGIWYTWCLVVCGHSSEAVFTRSVWCWCWCEVDARGIGGPRVVLFRLDHEAGPDRIRPESSSPHARGRCQWRDATITIVPRRAKAADVHLDGCAPYCFGAAAAAGAAAAGAAFCFFGAAAAGAAAGVATGAAG